MFEHRTSRQAGRPEGAGRGGFFPTVASIAPPMAGSDTDGRCPSQLSGSAWPVALVMFLMAKASNQALWCRVGLPAASL